MQNLEKIFLEIKNEIDKVSFEKGDLGDVGNIIGIVIGKYISNDLGFEKDDFIRGLKHGISLINGTH